MDRHPGETRSPERLIAAGFRLPPEMTARRLFRLLASPSNLL